MDKLQARAKSLLDMVKRIPWSSVTSEDLKKLEMLHTALNDFVGPINGKKNNKSKKAPAEVTSFTDENPNG